MSLAVDQEVRTPARPAELGSLGSDQQDREAAPFQHGLGRSAHRLQSRELAFAVRTAIDPTIPANAGSLRPVRVIAPAGTVVAALPPAGSITSGTCCFHRDQDHIRAFEPALCSQHQIAIRRNSEDTTMTHFNKFFGLKAITLTAALSMTAGLAFAGDNNVSSSQILDVRSRKHYGGQGRMK